MFLSAQNLLKHRRLEDDNHNHDYSYHSNDINYSSSDNNHQVNDQSIGSIFKHDSGIKLPNDTDVKESNYMDASNKEDEKKPEGSSEKDDDDADERFLSESILRNRSQETTSTANSSTSIYSIDLLKSIYPALSETESEFGVDSNLFEYNNKTIDDDDLDELETVVHSNHHCTTSNRIQLKKNDTINENSCNRNSTGEAINCNGVDNDDQRYENNLSLCNLVYERVLRKSKMTTATDVVSEWNEDRPFDEESLRALSQKSEVSPSDNAYCDSWDDGSSLQPPPPPPPSSPPTLVEEYILPPVDDNCNYFVCHSSTKVGIEDANELAIMQRANEHDGGAADTSIASRSIEDLGSFGSKNSLASSTEAVDNGKRRKKGSFSNPRRYDKIIALLMIVFLIIIIAITLYVTTTRRNDDGIVNDATSLKESNQQQTAIPWIDDDLADESSGNEYVKPSTNEKSVTTEILVNSSSIDPAQNGAKHLTDPLEGTGPKNDDGIISSSVPWIDSVEEQNGDVGLASELGYTMSYHEPIFRPLNFCEGDCDFDSDCDGDLICYQRDPNDPVPYCIGGETDPTRTDYCTHIHFDSSVIKSPSSANDEENYSVQNGNCTSSIAVVQDCFFLTENVFVASFENCDPQPDDWIGIYLDGSSLVTSSSDVEYVNDDHIDWAYTCGDQTCVDSPTTNSFAFASNYKHYLRGYTLRAYLIRNSNMIDNVGGGGAPYTIIAKSESFFPTEMCG